MYSARPGGSLSVQLRYRGNDDAGVGDTDMEGRKEKSKLTYRRQQWELLRLELPRFARIGRFVGKRGVRHMLATPGASERHSRSWFLVVSVLAAAMDPMMVLAVMFVDGWFALALPRCRRTLGDPSPGSIFKRVCTRRCGHVAYIRRRPCRTARYDTAGVGQSGFWTSCARQSIVCTHSAHPRAWPDRFRSRAQTRECRPGDTQLPSEWPVDVGAKVCDGRSCKARTSDEHVDGRGWNAVRVQEALRSDFFRGLDSIRNQYAHYAHSDVHVDVDEVLMSANAHRAACMSTFPSRATLRLRLVFRCDS
ncbi:hypothetical protein C8Q80DRAFT_1127476 [Daedaleopsis nitida]|nr:hypothetical protein C8Q80DRAFT_1127476 [Daedaleopsis nitida]